MHNDKNKRIINKSDAEALENFHQLIINIHLLHDDKEGCPWHTSQTHETLIPYLIEESNEFIDAFLIKNKQSIAEELGDILLQIMLHSEISSKQKEFELKDVIELLNQKIISRHPYIFKKKEKVSIQVANKIWAEQKRLERKHDEEKFSSMDLISKIQNKPPIMATETIALELDNIGIYWENSSQILEKLIEEIEELKEAINRDNTLDIIEEFGDIFFTLINLSFFLKINSQEALNLANKKFLQRISIIEEIIGDRINATSNNDFKKLWKLAKTKLESRKK
ncbi:MAG: nucleoside triphosphate pyrophosphohydrolase [Prochlorococcus sp. SP3034]|nr:nucleoside triphosphate pyrophosphohydrolase [Prochlorococcus sp. SP3034]|tara:strand:- start:106 stop:948 length:843 start_codon:yes stop_codon:yes gene_type:complete